MPPEDRNLPSTVSHAHLTSDRAEGTFFCFLKVEGLILWKTEDKALPEEKRDEDSGKLMLTGRSAEVRSQGKGCLECWLKSLQGSWGCGWEETGPGWLACPFLLMLSRGSGAWWHFPRTLNSCPGSTSRTMLPLGVLQEGPRYICCLSGLILLGTACHLSTKSQGSIQLLGDSLSLLS